MTKNNKNQFDVVVCGGGIRGLMSTHELLKQGYKVCLIESSPKLGGVLNSIPWKDYFLDIGCHLFDNSTEELTRQFFDIHADFHPMVVQYHSVMADNAIAHDMAVPDLTLMDADAKEVLSALQRVEGSEQGLTENYDDFLTQRFGEYNAKFLRQCVQKKTSLKASDLCHSAANVVLMNRVKMLEDAQSQELKTTTAFYDDRLAVASAKQPMMHYSDAKAFYPHRNFYPSQGGMGAFCQSYENYLQDHGAVILKNTKVCKLDSKGMVYTDTDVIVESDQLIWAGELGFLQQIIYQQSDMLDAMQSVAAALVYFEVPESAVSDVTYLHDYRITSPCYRISTAGKYSQQIHNGNTYVCGEVFMQTESPLWDLDVNNCDSVWQQMRELGIIDCETAVDTKVIKTPSAYRLPMIGYAASSAAFQEKLNAEYPYIATFKHPSFSKQKIFSEVKSLIESFK